MHSTSWLLFGALICLSAGHPSHLIAAEPNLEQYALTHAGDVGRGRALFNHTERTKCGLCHRVGESGGQIGPDLSSIGGKFDRPHLIESLLQPSQQMVEGYRSSAVLLRDGQVLTGIIKQQSDQEIVLYDANALEHRIARAKIDEIQSQSVSIMPLGLADSLTPDEFTDLIAYMETLRSSGASGAGSELSGPIALPEGFDVHTIVTGLTGATALEVFPDGRILVCEQTGSVRVIKRGKLLAQPLVTLPVDHEWERGVIGVTLDPGFPKQPYVYVCWVAKQPYPHHRVSRFEVQGDVALPDSEKVLLEGDDQTKMGGKVPAGHQGGGIHFGTDGKLYVGIGEQTAETPSQRLDTFLGKILRINADGSIPGDNPFLKKANGKYRAIWTYGMRNPFTFAFRPTDGLMLINDVGGKFEEINVGRSGGNYGWPVIPHGPAGEGKYVDPIHWYPEASISGGDFLSDAADWPAEFRGRYFFADFKHGWIHTINPASGVEATEFASGLRRPVDIRFAADGSLLVLLRNAWVIDGKFQPGTSSLLAIRPR